MKKKGIYRYHCPRHNVDYVGETARNFDTRHKEHFKAAEAGRWSHSGLTQHIQNCDAPIEGPEILSIAKKNKRQKQSQIQSSSGRIAMDTAI